MLKMVMTWITIVMFNVGLGLRFLPLPLDLGEPHQHKVLDVPGDLKSFPPSVFENWQSTAAYKKAQIALKHFKDQVENFREDLRLVQTDTQTEDTSPSSVADLVVMPVHSTEATPMTPVLSMPHMTHIKTEVDWVLKTKTKTDVDLLPLGNMKTEKHQCFIDTNEKFEKAYGDGLTLVAFAGNDTNLVYTCEPLIMTMTRKDSFWSKGATFVRRVYDEGDHIFLLSAEYEVRFVDKHRLILATQTTAYEAGDEVSLVLKRWGTWGIQCLKGMILAWFDRYFSTTDAIWGLTHNKCWTGQPKNRSAGACWQNSLATMQALMDSGFEMMSSRKLCSMHKNHDCNDPFLHRLNVADAMWNVLSAAMDVFAIIWDMKSSCNYQAKPQSFNPPTLYNWSKNSTLANIHYIGAFAIKVPNLINAVLDWYTMKFDSDFDLNHLESFKVFREKNGRLMRQDDMDGSEISYPLHPDGHQLTWRVRPGLDSDYNIKKGDKFRVRQTNAGREVVQDTVITVSSAGFTNTMLVPPAVKMTELEMQQYKQKTGADCKKNNDKCYHFEVMPVYDEGVYSFIVFEVPLDVDKNATVIQFWRMEGLPNAKIAIGYGVRHAFGEVVNNLLATMTHFRIFNNSIFDCANAFFEVLTLGFGIVAAIGNYKACDAQEGVGSRKEHRLMSIMGDIVVVENNVANNNDLQRMLGQNDDATNQWYIRIMMTLQRAVVSMKTDANEPALDWAAVHGNTLLPMIKTFPARFHGNPFATLNHDETLDFININ